MSIEGSIKKIQPTWTDLRPFKQWTKNNRIQTHKTCLLLPTKSNNTFPFVLKELQMIVKRSRLLHRRGNRVHTKIVFHPRFIVVSKSNPRVSLYVCHSQLNITFMISLTFFFLLSFYLYNKRETTTMIHANYFHYHNWCFVSLFIVVHCKDPKTDKVINGCSTLTTSKFSFFAH